MIKWIGQHIWDLVSRFRNDVYIESDVDAKPTVTISSGGTSQGGGHINFKRTATGADNQNLGDIYFIGNNDADEEIYYAYINGDTADASDGVEEGSLNLFVQSHGALRTGFTCVGNGAGVVDATIGTGSASVVTVPGRIVPTRIDLDGVGITAIQAAAEAFADNDTSLMTSAAIDDRIAAAGGGGGKQSFSFMKRVQVSASSDTTWYGGYGDNYYINATVYGLSTAKSGDNYTDVTASHWAANNYVNWTVASAATVTKFIISGVYQSTTSCDITVAIWKVSPSVDQTNHSLSTAAVDFIGEIELTADASDTSRMHAPPSALTSFQSGADLGAGDSIMLTARRNGSGSDGTYWYLRGAVEVTYD